MALHAQVTTTTGKSWVMPITLQVCVEWERWSRKSLADMADPTALDFAYLCWRAAIHSRQIHKRTRLDAFTSIVAGWEIVNIEANGIDQLEDWLKEQ